MLARYLLVWLSLLSWLAFKWPDWFGQASDPFLFGPLEYRILSQKIMFACAMFALGWLLPRDEIVQVARRWPVVLGGTTLQYVTMPALAFAVAVLFGFEGHTLTGVVIVGCVPGAMASNVLTLIARGNVSYSLSLTMSATMLSPLVVPIALTATLGQTDVEIRPLSVAIDLLWMTVIPVVLGHLASHRVPEKFREQAGVWGANFANLVILWIIACVVAANREKLREAQAVLPAALLLINILGYTAGWLGGLAMRLDSGMRRALVLEIGMQNAGLGSVLAATYFDNEAAMPAALYTFGCMLTGTILARIWHQFGAAASSARATDATG